MLVVKHFFSTIIFKIHVYDFELQIRNEMNTQMIQLDKDMSEYKEKSEKYQKEKVSCEICLNIVCLIILILT